jgi:hypothetical protein
MKGVHVLQKNPSDGVEKKKQQKEAEDYSKGQG